MARDGFGVYSPPAGTLATPSTTIESSKYNAFVNDLTADANAARPIVAGGTGATTASAARTNLGAQASSAALTSIAALTTAADKGIYTTASNTYATFDLTAAGRALLDDADAAAQLVTLGAQPSNANLTSLAGLTLAAGDVFYATGVGAVARLAKGSAFQSLKMNSAATAPEWVGIAQGGLTSTASGGPYGVNIPPGVRRIEVLFDRISLDSSGNWFVQIGPSSGVVTTGYESSSGNRAGGVGPATNGFVIFAADPSRRLTGRMTLTLMDSATNLWISDHSLGEVNSDVSVTGGGRVALSGALERLRLTYSAGNNPDGGQFRIQYE